MANLTNREVNLALRDGIRDRVELTSEPRLLWSLGDQADQSVAHPLSPYTSCVSSWYNGLKDDGWMLGVNADGTANTSSGYRHVDPDKMPGLVRAGRTHHVIVWMYDDPLAATNAAIMDPRIDALVETFATPAGSGIPWYVTLFTEAETYKSKPGVTIPGTYDADLVASFVRQAGRIRAASPEARVGFGLGGYAFTDTTTPTELTTYADAIAASDFVSVQQMQSYDTLRGGKTALIQQIRNTVDGCTSLGKPIAVSHFKVWADDGNQSGAAQAWRDVMADILAPSSLAGLVAKGLFFWSLMPDGYLTNTSEDTRAMLQRTGATRAHELTRVTTQAGSAWRTVPAQVTKAPDPALVVGDRAIEPYAGTFSSLVLDRPAGSLAVTADGVAESTGTSWVLLRTGAERTRDETLFYSDFGVGQTASWSLNAQSSINTTTGILTVGGTAAGQDAAWHDITTGFTVGDKIEVTPTTGPASTAPWSFVFAFLDQAGAWISASDFSGERWGTHTATTTATATVPTGTATIRVGVAYESGAAQFDWYTVRLLGRVVTRPSAGGSGSTATAADFDAALVP